MAVICIWCSLRSSKEDLWKNFCWLCFSWIDLLCIIQNFFSLEFQSCSILHICVQNLGSIRREMCPYYAGALCPLERECLNVACQHDCVSKEKVQAWEERYTKRGDLSPNIHLKLLQNLSASGLLPSKLVSTQLQERSFQKNVNFIRPPVPQFGELCCLPSSAWVMVHRVAGHLLSLTLLSLLRMHGLLGQGLRSLVSP